MYPLKRRLCKYTRKVFIIFVCLSLIIAAISWLRLPNHTDSGTFYDISLDDCGNLVNVHTQHNQNIKPTGVLLLTYLRSGSSMLGDLLQQHDEVFYVFDPIRALFKLSRMGKPIRWLNGSVSLNGMYKKADVQKQALEGLLTCDFSKVYAAVFDEFPFLEFGKKTCKYRNCILNKYFNTSRVNVKDSVNQTSYQSGLNEPCLVELRQMCLRSKIRIVKSVKTPMFMAEQIHKDTDSDIKLRVVHLVRDPRSMVLSLKKFLNMESVAPGKLAQNVCFLLWNDTQTIPYISVPVLTVFYETIVSNPAAEIKAIYDFVGLNFSDTIKKYAIKLVMNRTAEICIMCDLSGWRNNASNEHSSVDLSKKEIKLSDISDIQFYCVRVLSYYGYQVFDVMRVKRTNISVPV